MKILLSALIFFSVAKASANENLSFFLRSCAIGTGIGAGVGVVSLAFEDKPNEHAGNVARGASLGLYAGIGYGLLRLQDNAAKPTLRNNVGWLELQTHERKVDGVTARWAFSFR